MKSAVHGQYWVLEIKNANVKPAPLHHGKLLSSKRIHTYGVGLENIKSVVEQYEGVLSLQNEDCFTLNVMLPVPSAAKKWAVCINRMIFSVKPPTLIQRAARSK